MKLALLLFLATAGTLRVHSVPINNDQSSSLTLQDDLNDFLVLLPDEEIQNIVLEYLSNDADFQETLQYLVSKDFTSLILEIEAMPDAKAFLKYLHDAGLDVYKLINNLHDILGLEHYVPLRKQFFKGITGGLPGLIKDIEAILPLQEIQALYEKKLQSSPEFANLVKHLQSSEFQNTVNNVFKNPKVQDLIKRAKAKGVDVKAILDLVTKILGIKFPGNRSITLGMQEDINDFLRLIPTKQIQDLVFEYLATDRDFQKTMDYIMSEEFHSLILDIEAIPEVRMFIKYLNDVGLDVYNGLEILHDFLGIDHYVPFAHNYGLFKITGGLSGLIEDIKAMLPVHEIQELYEEKLRTSAAFRGLVEQLKSDKSQKIVDIVWANEKFIKLINRAEAKGVDVKAILQLLTDILGIKFPASRQARSVTMGLNDDLQEFLALVPRKEIVALVMEYLTSDADFQEAVEYIMSNDFKKLVLEIEAIPDVKLFIKYLSDAGLDVYSLINQLHDFLGLDHMNPFAFDEDESYEIYGITGGLPGLIADVKKILPVDKIQALYKQKLESSPEFAALIKRLGSPEFQKIVDTVWGNPTLQELIKRAEAKGVDVKAILKLITEILGIHFPSGRYFSSTLGLNDDLQEFLALVPRKEIEALVMEYLTTDADFQEAVEYMMSNDFKKLVLEIESIQDVKTFIKYLKDAGLDVYTLLNKIHDFLGLDHVNPFVFDEDESYEIYGITGGLPGLIADVKKILPVDKIQALYKQKLESSPEFAALIKRLGSPEFQKIVDTVWGNPTLQELIKRAEAKGVDVKAILKLITEILGIHFPSGRYFSSTLGLNDDLQEFLALVPRKEIEALVMEYLTSDADFQEAVEYMLSKDFKKLVQEIEAIPDVKLFIKYLSDAGLDVYSLINQLHDLLGLDHITPLRITFGAYKITGGLPGLIADVKKILPVEKIEALYKQKLESSPEFAALIKRLGSPEFQKIVNTVWGNSTLQELIKKAEAKGVDVKAILKLITEILGIHFPGSRSQYQSPIFVRYETNLNDDLNDLMALIPMNDVLEVALEYVTVDKDFQIFVEYLQSAYFGGLITDIENIAGVPKFLQYLHKSGLDVYTFLNKLHRIWNLDPISPPSSLNFIQITGGLPGFINDIIAVLPVDKIKKVYNEKLENSAALKDLLKQIQKPEFQKMVDTLMINERLNDLMTKVEQKGVNVNVILKAISKLLGIRLPSRPRSSMFVNDALMKDLHDFTKLVPKKKISKIVINYALVDKHFKKVIKYMRSNDFHKLIHNVEATQEMKQFLEYLNTIGLDVYKWMKVLHKILGMEKEKIKFYTTPEKISGGINGLIKDIKAVLPVKELSVLYDKKLKDSPVFAEFVERLRSQELQNLINALAKIDEVERVLKKLEALDVDVNGILQLLSKYFGIKFPPRPGHYF